MINKNNIDNIYIVWLIISIFIIVSITPILVNSPSDSLKLNNSSNNYNSTYYINDNNVISGKIKDEDGNYVVGATVKALDSNGDLIAKKETDCSGTYSFDERNIDKLNVIYSSSDYCLDGPNDDEGSTIADFEGGSLPSDWSDEIPDYSDPIITSSRSSTGSYSLDVTESDYDTLGTGTQYIVTKWQPDALKDGEAVKELSFRWNEGSSSFGTAWSLRDDKGNRIMAVSTDNPQAEYYDPVNDEWVVIDSSGDYDVWNKFTLDINYENSEYDLVFERADGTTSTVDNIPFDKKSLTYEFTMHSFASGSWTSNPGYGADDLNIYIDDVEIKY